jgi:hypothetical protein
LWRHVTAAGLALGVSASFVLEMPQTLTAAPASGSLSVESNPAGASLYVDGQFVGLTPLTIEADAGPHRVRLVNTGYLENSRVVVVDGGKTTAVRASLTAGVVQSSQPALRIVVIQGEGGVNIIERQTAVAPIVEVRDRNDQPVAGAVVAFLFRGAGQVNAQRGVLRITTDALGRATANGLVPTRAGAMQINVTASFQGQTASITISQANFATAAQAAAAQTGGGSAGAAGAASAATAGGGAASGLSAATIGIIGAAAGGGALAVTKVASGGSSDGGCAYTLNPASQAVPGAGGNFTVALTTSCAWSAQSDQPFLTITNGASGNGNATIAYRAAASSASSARDGHITVTGAGGTASLTVTQTVPPSAALTISFSPDPVPFVSCSGTCHPYTTTYTVRETNNVGLTSLTTTFLFNVSGQVLQVGPFDETFANPIFGVIGTEVWNCFGPSSCASQVVGGGSLQMSITGVDVFGHTVSASRTVIFVAP